MWHKLLFNKPSKPRLTLSGYWEIVLHCDDPTERLHRRMFATEKIVRQYGDLLMELRPYLQPELNRSIDREVNNLARRLHFALDSYEIWREVHPDPIEIEARTIDELEKFKKIWNKRLDQFTETEL